MGIVASIQALPAEGKLTNIELQKLAGEYYNDSIFQAIKEDGDVVDREKILKIANSTKYFFDLYLTYDWGMDETERDNHIRVSTINNKLIDRGLVTYFDNNPTKSSIATKLCDRIDRTSYIVVFITKRYMTKVNSNDANDVCQLEFMYAKQKKGSKRMIPIICDESCKALIHDMNLGPVPVTLGNNPSTYYIDYTADEFADKVVEQIIEKLVKRRHRNVTSAIGSKNKKMIVNNQQVIIEDDHEVDISTNRLTSTRRISNNESDNKPLINYDELADENNYTTILHEHKLSLKDTINTNDYSCAAMHYYEGCVVLNDQKKSPQLSNQTITQKINLKRFHCIDCTFQLCAGCVLSYNIHLRSKEVTIHEHRLVESIHNNININDYQRQSIAWRCSNPSVCKYRPPQSTTSSTDSEQSILVCRRYTCQSKSCPFNLCEYCVDHYEKV